MVTFTSSSEEKNKWLIKSAQLGCIALGKNCMRRVKHVSQTLPVQLYKRPTILFHNAENVEHELDFPQFIPYELR